MGVTYKAIDTHLRCPVALKIISAQFIGNESARSRFLREARAAASVCHPNVATVHHLGESGGNYFYRREVGAGETLETLIRPCDRLGIEIALEIVTQRGWRRTCMDNADPTPAGLKRRTTHAAIR